MPSRYSSSELHNIKARNIHRLPPATAVHGMALYESHRDAEQERLFHDAMFDLSNLKQTKAAQHARLSSLEASVKACASHHDSDRPISLGCGKHVTDH
jgi:cell division septum initiation protein DivIVA